MNNTTRNRILRLRSQGFTPRGIAKETGLMVDEVRRVLHAESQARYRNLSEEEKAVRALRREGHPEAVIRANFPSLGESGWEN